MNALSFAERYRQARLYARQVRVRRAMGDRYDHARPWRGLPRNKGGTTKQLTGSVFDTTIG